MAQGSKTGNVGATLAVALRRQISDPCGGISNRPAPPGLWLAVAREAVGGQFRLDAYGAIPCGRRLGNCVALLATSSLAESISDKNDARC